MALPIIPARSAPTSPSILERIKDLRQIAVLIATDNQALNDPERVRTTFMDLDKGLKELAALCGGCLMSHEDQQITQGFGRALRAERERQGLSLADLAGLAEIPEAQLAQVEAGALDLPVMKVIELAIALKVSAGELVARALERPS